MWSVWQSEVALEGECGARGVYGGERQPPPCGPRAEKSWPRASRQQGQAVINRWVEPNRRKRAICEPMEPLALVRRP